MKKMQCEVCGSREIKKVSDDTFECQSCGIQYSANDVKKLLVEIKVDHSGEVENNIKRAEQMVEDGNLEKAEAYLNKALDMDAENEKAKEQIAAINANKKLEAYHVIKPTVDPKNNVKDFLKQLATKEHIVVDIYKEIDITSVTETYIPMIYTYNNCLCEWSAVACSYYYEKETQYKKEYDKNKGDYVQVPYTVDVKKVNKVPRTGKTVYDNAGFGFASKAVISGFNSEVGEEYSTYLADFFEDLQAEKFDGYSVKKLSSKNVEKRDDEYYLDGYKLDLFIDSDICSAKKQEVYDNANKIGQEKVYAAIGGDFFEDFSGTIKVIEEDIKYVLLPVQIINYTYKGASFVAVSDLVSKTTKISCVCPCDVTLKQRQDEVDEINQKASGQGGLTVFGIIAAIIGGICIGVAPEDATGLLVFACVALFGGILLTLIGAIKQKIRKDKAQNRTENLKLGLFLPVKLCLSKNYKAFFEVIDNGGTLEEAKNAVPNDTLISNSVYISLESNMELEEFSLLDTTNEAIDKSFADIKNNREKIAELTALKKKKATPLLWGSCGMLFLSIILGASIDNDFGAVLILGGLLITLVLFIVGLVRLGNYNRAILDIKAQNADNVSSYEQ